MPGRELEPIGHPGPALSEVAAEMRAIFEEAGLGGAAAGLRPPPSVSALRPGRRGGGAATWLAAAAAGLAGLGAGAFVIHMPAPSPTAPTQGALPVAAAPAARPEPPLALAQAAPSAVQPALASPPSAAAPGHAPLRADRRAPPKAVLAKAPSRRRGSGPIAQPASCERNAVGVGCRRAVIQADRHLRAVYENAVRRGVPHGVLVDYRDRWADLRESGSDDPVRLIESYGALAYDLGREARDQEAAAAPRRGSSGWRAVADAFRPLPLR